MRAAVPVSVCDADRVVDGLGVTALEGVLEEEAPAERELVGVAV